MEVAIAGSEGAYSSGSTKPASVALGQSDVPMTVGTAP